MNLNDITSELNTLSTIPEYRRLARRIAREDYRDFLDTAPKEEYRFRLMYAFVLGYARDEFSVLVRYFEDFIPLVTDWSVNDSLCQSFKIARHCPGEMYSMLMRHADTTREFESRVVSVTLLSHFLNDEYIDRVMEVLDRLYSGEYYASMGIAWALATIMGKYPDRCLAYLKSDENHLDDATYRRTLRKIRESYRVSPDIKAMTRELNTRHQ